MAYHELAVKRVPPRLSKNQIDCMWQAEKNAGRYWVPHINGAIHIDEWRENLYRMNGVVDGEKGTTT